jgi:methylmalonyl-CoA mutase C-terminal domain/subunit
MTAAGMVRVEDLERVAVRELEDCEAVLAVLELETEDVPGERRHLVKARRARAEPDDALQFHETRLDCGTVARKIRVVIAKLGSTGTTAARRSSRGHCATRGWRSSTPGHQTPEQIVETAIQEDADAVGISILSGAHVTLVPRILDGLKENGADDMVVVVVGGTISREDTEELKGLVLRVGIANHNCGPEWSSPRVGRLARSAGSPGEQGNAFRLAPLEVRR